MKKKIKQILASLLVGVMVLASAPMSAFAGLNLPDFFNFFASAESYSGTCGENLTWTLDTITGELVISGTGDMKNYSYSSAPWYGQGYEIKTVTIQENVTSIGGGAFYSCESLTSVTIPDSVTSIGYSAFEYCDNLTNVTIPNSVTSIGDSAFLGCDSLTNITIPDSVTSIGDSVFENCRHLTSVTIPDSVTSIGDATFSDCTSLTSITIPDSVKSIGGAAFHDTDYYSDSSNWVNDVLYIGKYLIEAKNTISGEYTIKEGTKCIADSAFAYCDNLTSVIIPDGLTSIGAFAFAYSNNLASVMISDSVTSIGAESFLGCPSLTSVTIPNGVTSIGALAFGFSGLTSIIVSEDNTAYSSDEYGVLYNKKKTELIQYPTGNERNNYEIPNSVISIGKFAFYYCRNLINVDIPNSVTCICDYAFYSCNGLMNIEIPDSVTIICESAFAYCDSLKSVIIPDSVVNIGVDAFRECPNLSNVIIPNSVISIGYSAFRNCESITSISIPDSVTSIGSSAFESCTSLTSVTVGDGLKNIDLYMFAYCTNLTSVTIGNSVTSIDYHAFHYCDSLTSITIPDSVTSIGNSAFKYCDSLTDVYYAGSEEQWRKITIGDYNEDLLNATIHFFDDNEECRHNYISSITTQPTCTSTGVMTYTCSACGDTYTEVIPMKGHELIHDIIPSTCKVAGMDFDLCLDCGGTFNVIKRPLNPHDWSEWTVTVQPTGTSEGVSERTCSGCGEKETQSIPKLGIIKDQETGVEIEFDDEYESGVEIEVEEVFDGDSFRLIEYTYGNVNTHIFDISTVKDGEKVQPDGKVKVRIPLPAGFGTKNIYICYVDSVNGTVTNIPAKVVDGYVEFEADHFSYYAVVEKLGKVHSVSIDNVSMNYKDSTTITPSVNADAGVKYTVSYSSSDESVARVDSNGNVTATGKGNATITVTVTDEYGNTVTDTCDVEVKYAWWQWIIVIVLFGWIWY